jgi:glycosyltransferase involved in cell wall biosynthesis
MTPDFSVVVPTYRRPDALRRCLDALASLDPTGPTFELLVVDDGGTSVPDALAITFRPRLEVTVLRPPHGGPAAARNVGLRAARGRWLAFTDDDCTPEAGWLTGFARRFADLPDHGLGGYTINRFEGGTYATAQQLLVDYFNRLPEEPGARPSFFPTNNIALPTDALRALGGFDESFPFAAGEDRDLCDRWLASGRLLAEAPGAVVRHNHPLGFGGFCRLHHRYGRGARAFHRRRAGRNGSSPRLEPPAFYTGLLLAPFAAGERWRVPSLCAALLLSQVCHTTGYAAERWAERRRPPARP